MQLPSNISIAPNYLSDFREWCTSLFESVSSELQGDNFPEIHSDISMNGQINSMNETPYVVMFTGTSHRLPIKLRTIKINIERAQIYLLGDSLKDRLTQQSHS